MMATLAMLAFAQSAEADPAKLRAFFENVVQFRIVKGDLRLGALIDESKFKEIWAGDSILELGFTTSPWGGHDFYSDGPIGHMMFDLDRSGELKQLTVSLRFCKEQKSFYLRASPSGALRIVYHDEDGGTFLYIQNKDGRCKLLVDDDGKFDVSRGKNFEELALKHPNRVEQSLVPVLERYLARVPPTPFRTEVVSLALSLRCVTADVASALADRVARLEDESADVRDVATRALSEQSRASIAVLYYLVKRAKTEKSVEARARLNKILRADERRWELLEYVSNQGLHRDLSYLVNLLSANKLAGERLKELTGQSFESATAWTKWLEKSKPRLRWDEKTWRYELASEDE